jgi:SAM-dependent methyltransferase
VTSHSAESLSQYYESYWSEPTCAPPAHDPRTPTRWRWALDCLREAGARKVLHLGCGTGDFARVLRTRGHRVCGMDISRTALAAAHRGCPEAGFVRYAADIAPWPFADAEFDAITAFEVFEHLLDVPVAFAEARRALRRGGRLILTVPYHGLVKNLVIALLSFETHFDVQGPHIRFFTVNSLRRARRQADLTVVQRQNYGRFWPTPMGMFVVASAGTMWK